MKTKILLFTLFSLLLLSLPLSSAENISVSSSLAGLYNGYGDYYSFSLNTEQDILVGNAYVGTFPTGQVYLIPSHYTNGTSTGLSTVQIGDFRSGMAYVESTSKWYGVAGESTVCRIAQDLSSSEQCFGGFSNIASITTDEQYLYTLVTNGEVRKYDFNMNFIQVVGTVPHTVNVESEIDFVTQANAFITRHGNNLYVYDKNLQQYGNTHLLLGTTTLRGLENNGTHILTSSYVAPKSVFFYNVQNILPPYNVTPTSYTPIYPTGDTIDLTLPVGRPKSHAQDGTYQYILSDGEVIYRFQTSNFAYNDALCISSGWDFIGKYEDNILVRKDNNEIVQLSESCDLLQTRTLDNVDNAGDLKVIGDDLYIISTEGRVIVYGITENAQGILSYIYIREFALDRIDQHENIFITGYDIYLYVLDTVEGTIFRYDTTGGFIEAWILANWTSSENPTDLFFYKNDFYVIDINNSQAVEYNLPQIQFVDYQTIGGVNYGRTYCVTETQLCSNTTHTVDINGDVISYCPDTIYITSCPIEATTGGCTNTLNTTSNIIEGSCETVSCSGQVNECQVANEGRCTSIDTYELCGQYDTDVCLEYSPTLYCPIGQYCSEGQCSLLNETAFGDFVLAGQSVEAIIGSTNGYEVSEENDKITIASLFTTAWVGFEITGLPTNPKYSSHIADYKETIRHTDYLTISPSTNGWSGTIDYQSASTPYYLEVQDTETVTKTFNEHIGNKLILYEITFADSNPDRIHIVVPQYRGKNGNLIAEHRITYTESTGTVVFEKTVNKGSGVTLFTDTGTGINNLNKIVVEMTVNTEIKNIYYNVIIYRQIGGSSVPIRYHTIPFGYITPEASTFTKLTFNNTQYRSRILGVELTSIPNLPSYQSVDYNNEFQERPTYIDTGCYTARLYGSQYNIPTYHFYTDKEICVTEVAGAKDEDEAQAIKDSRTILGTNIEDFDLALAIVILVIIAGLTIFVAWEMDTQTQRNAIVIIGTIIFGLATVYFVSVDIIEAWVIGLLILLGVGVAVLMFKRGMQ